MAEGTFSIPPIGTRYYVQVTRGTTTAFEEIPGFTSVTIEEGAAPRSEITTLAQGSIANVGDAPPPSFSGDLVYNPKHPTFDFIKENVSKEVRVRMQTAPEAPIFNETTARVEIAEDTGLCTFTVLQPPVGTATVKGDIAAGHAIIIGGKAYIVRLVDGTSVYVIEESTGIAPDADVDAVAYKIVRPQIRAEKRFTISQSGGFTSGRQRNGSHRHVAVRGRGQPEAQLARGGVTMSRKRKASNLVQGLLARWNRTETVEVDGHPLKLATPSAKAFIDMQVQGAAAMDAVRAEHEEGTSAYTAAVFQAGVDQGIKGLRACVDAADPGQLERVERRSTKALGLVRAVREGRRSG